MSNQNFVEFSFWFITQKRLTTNKYDFVLQYKFQILYKIFSMFCASQVIS